MRSFWSKYKNEKKPNVNKYVLDTYSKLRTRLSGKSFKFWLENGSQFCLEQKWKHSSEIVVSMSISSHRIEKLGWEKNCNMASSPAMLFFFVPFLLLTFRWNKRKRQLYFISRTGAVIDYTIQWHISYRIRLCKGWKKEWQPMKTI